MTQAALFQEETVTGAERLTCASIALRAQRWSRIDRKNRADALRMSILELAELLDAHACARECLDMGKRRTVAYLARVDAFIARTIDLVVALAIRPEEHDLPNLAAGGSCELPVDVLDEIADDPTLSRHVFEASVAWKRAREGLHRIGGSFI